MNYYQQIKRTLVGNVAYQRVKDYSKNRQLLRTYYEVGRILVEAQGGEKRAKYGNQLIREYSQRLSAELGKGYTVTNLKYMRQFYLFIQKGQTVSDQLTWSHYVVLLQLDESAQINYYIWLSEQQNLSVRQLRERIKVSEYERLPAQTKQRFMAAANSKVGSTRTLGKITEAARHSDALSVVEYIKDPILIRGKDKITTEFSEQILQQLIMEDLPHFLKELGSGFSFIDNEYKIKVDREYNYIDLLLFNVPHNCYVVVELKITELKAEHIGQIQKYMKAVDTALATPMQQSTVGIVITRKNNQFIKGYCSDERIFGVEWRMVG